MQIGKIHYINESVSELGSNKTGDRQLERKNKSKQNKKLKGDMN